VQMSLCTHMTCLLEKKAHEKKSLKQQLHDII